MLILIIEDDAGLVELIKEKVEECGYEPAHASAARKAIEWLSVNTPYLMLLDYTLPDMNAKEFITELQKSDRALPPFIVSTGKGDERIAVEMMKLGARDYIVKDALFLDMLPELIRKAAREIENENRRREAEELLDQTRRNYETFFNTIDEFLFVLDEQGNIIHTNNMVTERLGFTKEELDGKSVLVLHPPERRDEAGKIVMNMLNGLAEFCPIPLLTKNGVQIPVETRVSRGYWDGKPVIFGVTKDISMIKFSEEKFSKLFYINPSACGLSDVETHQYIEVNEAFYNLFGFERNEVIGRTAWDLKIFTPETVNAILSKADSSGSIKNVEAELRAKNGEIKHVLLSAENMFVQDRKYRFTVVHDITGRKQAEDRIKSLLAEKELILREVHHRIKNNMNTIKGLLYLQAETLQDQSAVAALKDAENRVASMMLLYDKLYRSTAFKELSIKEYLPGLADEIIGNFPNRKIVRIETHIENFTLNAEILFSLGIIVNEILTNMMKYAFTGRNSGVIKITASIKGALAEIIMQDNGIGIPETVSFESSTGFGLQLVKMLSEQIGGSIKMKRAEGTTFILEFKV